MSDAGFRFIINEDAWDELFRSEHGPVGELVAELSERGAVAARSLVHVRPGTPRSTVWTHRSTAFPVGYTKASIHSHGVHRGADWLYGGVNAEGEPTVFLEHPASQMYKKYPFLTTALDLLEI